MVLNGVSFKVERGMVFCIIGPNGSGKTTILKIIDLLEEPDRGEVLLDGVNISSLSPSGKIFQRRKIAMVFQQPVLYDTDVYHNVSIGLEIRGVDEQNRRERVDEVLRAVNLYDRRKDRAITLSGGEAQRLCIARALVLKPDILLLDEPTANLDPANTSIVENVVRDYVNRKRGIIIFTTHNMFEARRLAERVLFLLNGNVIEEDEADRFFRNPKDKRAAEFIKGEIVLG